MRAGIVETDAQVLQQALFASGNIVEGHRLVEYAVVACLLEICEAAEEQPERVVVETGSYSVVASLRERLILVVAAAVRELRRRDVKYALTCAFRYLVHKADKVLVGVPESHTSADSALEITGAAAHVEGDHTLVLVPNIHHAVQLFYSCRGLELA